MHQLNCYERGESHFYFPSRFTYSKYRIYVSKLTVLKLSQESQIIQYCMFRQAERSDMCPQRVNNHQSGFVCPWVNANLFLEVLSYDIVWQNSKRYFLSVAGFLCLSLHCLNSPLHVYCLFFFFFSFFLWITRQKLKRFGAISWDLSSKDVNVLQGFIIFVNFQMLALLLKMSD